MVLTKEKLCVYLVFLRLSVSDFLKAVLCIGLTIYVHACNWNTKHEILNMKVNFISKLTECLWEMKLGIV